MPRRRREGEFGIVTHRTIQGLCALCSLEGANTRCGIGNSLQQSLQQAYIREIFSGWSCVTSAGFFLVFFAVVDRNVDGNSHSGASWHFDNGALFVSLTKTDLP